VDDAVSAFTKALAKVEGKGKTSSFCHFTATTLLHEAVAQALIGHDSEAMHELYISVGHEALEKATAALPEI
jgi:hypothetical protein